MTDSLVAGHSHRMASTAPRRREEAGEPFERTYEATFAPVWRTLRRLGVPACALDDAAQDVFIVVHRRLRDFEGRSSVRTWVLGIAARVAKDHRRGQRRQGERAPLDEGLVDTRPGPAEAASQAEARARVAQLLRGLDEGQREVFVLVELEGLTVPEVAETLGLKLNTAYSRLRLARRAFSEAVARQAGEVSGG